MKSARVFLIDDLRLDLDARRVFRDTEEIELGRLTFDLLAALARAAPAALSTDEIVARVWDSAVVSDETLKQRVSLLRRALGHDSGRSYVETVRAYGYRLATVPVPAPFGTDEPDSPSHAERASNARHETEVVAPAPTRAFGARWLRAALITLVILALLLVLTVLAMLLRQVKRWSPGSVSAVSPVSEVASLPVSLPSSIRPQRLERVQPQGAPDR